MLTTEGIAQATRLNPIWREKLADAWPSEAQFAAVGIGEADVVTPEFAQQVEAYQAAHALAADGVVGPRTAGTIRTGETWTRPAGGDSFIVDGERIQVAGIPILDWTETGLTFGAGRGAVARRTEPVSMGHLHTTGGEGSYHQVWNTLVGRNLSVDALVDVDVFVQYTDPARVATMHAGWANPVSWGFEITNDIDPSRGGRARPRIMGTLFGRPHTWDGLLPAQAEMLPPMVKAWCDAFRIPHRIPGRNGRPLDGPVVERSAVLEYRRLKQRSAAQAKRFAEPLISQMRAAYTGTVVGHFMTSLTGKPDPSPDCLDVLLRAGFDIKEV